MLCRVDQGCIVHRPPDWNDRFVRGHVYESIQFMLHLRCLIACESGGLELTDWPTKHQLLWNSTPSSWQVVKIHLLSPKATATPILMILVAQLKSRLRSTANFGALLVRCTMLDGIAVAVIFNFLFGDLSPNLLQCSPLGYWWCCCGRILAFHDQEICILFDLVHPLVQVHPTFTWVWVGCI